MKIKNLIHDLMVEAVMSKATYGMLSQKWGAEKPNITKDEIQNVYDEFKKIQSSLSEKNPAVKTFLYRFDGNHGYPKYEGKSITDITQYTYQQIKSLLGEFQDEMGSEIRDSEFKGFPPPTPDLIEKSKELWTGTDNAIVVEDGFRVYKIKDQGMAMAYGYFSQAEASRLVGGGHWCVTWRKDNGTNQWEYYRTTNRRTFYFVIDESKLNNPNDPNFKYYLGALQRTPATSGGYVITSMRNGDDTNMTWEQVLRIYPKLVNHKNLIESVPFNDEELKIKDLASKINEQPGNKYEFKRLERKDKKFFINSNGIIRKAESWAHMDTGLRELYISITQKENAMEKFGNFEMLNEIRKVGNQFTLLDNKLKALGFKDGVGSIMSELLSNRYKIRRISIDNPQIKVYEDLSTQHLCGVWHDRHGNWLKYQGVSYDPVFQEGDDDIYLDESGKKYFVEEFVSGSNKFYVMYPVNVDQDVRGHFFSESKWNELKPKLYPEDGLGTFDNDADVDIKETKKGV